MLNAQPQRLTLLRPRLIQPAVHQHLQQLAHPLRITLAPKHRLGTTTRVSEPETDDINQVVGDEAPIAALEGRFFVVEHAFQHGNHGFVGHLEVDECVRDPGLGRDVVLEFVRVALEHGEEVGHGEHGFREVESLAQAPYFLADAFVRGLAFRGGLFVDAFEEVLPCGFDVGGIAVVGGLVDEDADVEVACLVGVAVVELAQADDLAVERFDDFRFSLRGDSVVGAQPLEEIVLDVGDV